MTNQEFAPFSISHYEDGRFGLILGDFDDCYEIFDEFGYENGGYGWHGVAEALIRLKAPHLAKKIKFDPEASMFAAHAKKRDDVEELARLLRAAIDDESLLRSALENADPELMD
jgi:hypothetical protein